MGKLQLATWALWYPTLSTKMFTTRINEQNVVLYNVRDPLYINNVKPDLTEDQVTTVLNFITNTLLVDFASEIQDALNQQQIELNTAIDDIIE